MRGTTLARMVPIRVEVTGASELAEKVDDGSSSRSAATAKTRSRGVEESFYVLLLEIESY
jgi:hypothetical protein